MYDKGYEVLGMHGSAKLIRRIVDYDITAYMESRNNPPLFN